MDKPTGQTELRILLLEDEPTDAELAEEALREAGLSFIAKRVDTRDAFIRALEEFKPDIVIADYKLPAFDGGSALKIVRQQYPAIPVVMVTGAMGDEKAIELLRLGARDYVLKDRLMRLGPAVQRALSEERGIRARHAAEKALHDSEEKFHAIFDGALDGIVLADAETRRFATGNPAFCRMVGYSPEEIPRIGVSDIHPQQDLPHVIEQFKKLSRGEIQLAANIPVKRKDGSVFYADIKGSPVSFGGKPYLMGIFRDISERKQAESRLTEQLDELRRWHEATLGREMRVLELKHEVNELLAQARQPPRYPSAEADDGRHTIV
jgi:PAS domain S-box-containing protein